MAEIIMKELQAEYMTLEEINKGIDAARKERGLNVSKDSFSILYEKNNKRTLKKELGIL